MYHSDISDTSSSVTKAFRPVCWRTCTTMIIKDDKFKPHKLDFFFSRMRSTSQIMDSSQIYVNPHSCQNPSLGSLTRLAPQKTETWLCDQQSIKKSPSQPHSRKKSNPVISSCPVANLHTQIEPRPHSSAFSDWILVA